eukprot:COSAG03_NODE_3117_length_2205_cov_2.890313_2_plen_109_part_00
MFESGKRERRERRPLQEVIHHNRQAHTVLHPDVPVNRNKRCFLLLVAQYDNWYFKQGCVGSRGLDAINAVAAFSFSQGPIVVLLECPLSRSLSLSVSVSLSLSLSLSL